MLRFKTKSKLFDVGLTTVVGLLSVVTMILFVVQFGLKNTWPELVLTMFYLTCLVLMCLFFFNRLKPEQFNYWCTVCIGVTILLRDILFAPTIESNAATIEFKVLRLICLVLAVTLLLMLTYFYSRKDWKSYTKGNLWLIFVVDMVLAALYNYSIFIGPSDEYTPYLLIEIWIRPTITYGLVAFYVTESETKK